jgi:hypothetical protein
MLSQGLKTAWRTFPVVVSPAKGPQLAHFLGPLRHPSHVRHLCMSPRPIALQITPNYRWKLSPKYPLGIHAIPFRSLSTTRVLQKEAQVTPQQGISTHASEGESADEVSLEFKRTKKGEAAREVDLSARLKDRSTQSDKGEVIRLLKLAGREWRTLSGKHPTEP